ncbi:MAG: MBOAT family O-acyltransferase [Eubacteriales bacterium]|nr:MBOAT family O-acyltransferase [Eubacteriales bacterium]
MVFSSPSFLFIFLPVTVLLSRLFHGRKGRNAFLAAAGLIFYSFGQLSALPLLLLSVLISYAAGLLMLRRDNPRYRKNIMLSAVAAHLLILALFKYIPPMNSVLPIGISFYTFHGISYVVDVYRGKSRPEKDPVALLLYISFFPRLISGPIVEYSDFESQLENSEVSAERTAYGIIRFVEGFAKKMLIASVAAKAADHVFNISAVSAAAAASVLDFRLAWLGAAAYAIQIYFDFSGYSDMAIGLSAMFGFSTAENFDLPYAALSVREFWRRWHISLSSWFRDYLYIPLGGSRKGRVRAAANRMLVFLCTGIWHGAGMNYLLWGLCHGALVSLEGAGIIPTEKLQKSFVGRLVSRIYTLLSVVLLFVIFRAQSLGAAWEIISSMFRFCRFDSAVPELAGLLNGSMITVLIAGFLLSGRLMAKLRPVLQSKISACSSSVAFLIVAVLVAVLLFVVSLMSMSSSGFSPFIYFQF